MFERAQMNKGLLEGCILAIIGRESVYGYDIAEQLGRYGFADVREGTVYPLLVRLERKGLLAAEYRPSPVGPSRKYYRLTEDGTQYLHAFIKAWRETAASVDAVLGGDPDVGKQL